MLPDPPERDLDQQIGASKIDPFKAVIFHSVIIAGILAVHFGVAPLW